MAFPIKLTKSEKERRLGRLNRQKRALEEGRSIRYPDSKQVLHSYRNFISLPQAQQIAIRQEWEQYYKKTRETPSYGIFRAQRDAWNDDKTRVRELAVDAKNMQINGDDQTIPIPTGIDPWEYSFGNILSTYKAIDREIKELIDFEELEQQEEVKDIWT